MENTYLCVRNEKIYNMDHLKEITEEIDRLIKYENGKGISERTKAVVEAYNELKSYIDSLSEEKPEHGFVESCYVCGKKPNWNVGDTLMYQEFASDHEGVYEIGKVKEVVLDECIDEWVYTFEDGHKETEYELLSVDVFRKVMNKKNGK